MAKRKRILFMAEAVTLAHLARPYALAKLLDPATYEIVFACAGDYLHLFPEWLWQRETLYSIPPSLFMNRLARGARVYTLKELKKYATEDLELIARIRPDVIVGDFRLSLSASARVARIPYITVTNAYWSPFARDRHFPMPSLPITRFLGVPITSTLFALARPFAFSWHAIPINQLRQSYSLPPIGLDLRKVYTDADITLYADTPELIPTDRLPSNHLYIGPLDWSPKMAMPELPPAGRPLIYVTLGSSGSSEALPRIVEILGSIDCYAIVATAGVKLSDVPSNVFAADYLPGSEMSEHANLVICNGGSPTSQQALARGVPVLGIPSNLDQHLNMRCICRVEAGITLRPQQISTASLRAAISRLIGEKNFSKKAAELSRAFSRYKAGIEFNRAIATVSKLT